MASPFQQHGRLLVCRPEGDLDEAAVSRIAEALKAEGTQPKGVVLDMAGTSYISSQGVAALLKFQTALAERKRSLALAAPPPLVKRILYQAGVASAIPVHTTVEEACGEKPAA